MDNLIKRNPPACYRVVARRRDHSEWLVTLAENPRQAANLARAFCQRLEADPRRHDIVFVRTEEWVGFLTHGEWRPVRERDGGFFFRFSRKKRAGKRADGKNNGR